jgi:hypothetical protein
MEKRVLGIILSILGIAGLIIASIELINGGEGAGRGGYFGGYRKSGENTCIN